jgi:hypothetical protein
MGSTGLVAGAHEKPLPLGRQGMGDEATVVGN